MEDFYLILFCISMGYLVQKLDILPKDLAMNLNQFAIYILLPAMVLLQVPKLSFSTEFITPIVVAWVVMGSTAGLTLYLSRWFGFSKEVTGALLLVTILGNSSFMGIPLVKAYYGEEALPFVLIYDQLGTFIAFSLYGTFIAAYYSAKSEISVGMLVRKIFSFPPFLALLVSLTLMGVEFDKNVTYVLSSLANCIIPVALIAVGLQLQLRLEREEMAPFALSLGIKLVLAPLIAFAVCSLFGWNDLSATVAIMEAGMASMITAGAIASVAGLAPKLSTSIVGYSILLSFVSTNILYALL